MYKRNSQSWLKHLDFILLDALALHLGFLLAYMIRHGSHLPYFSKIYLPFAVLWVTADVMIAAMFNTMTGVLRRGYYREATQTAKHVFLVLLVITLYLFAVQSGVVYSRITVGLTAVFHLIFGYTARVFWKPMVRRIAMKSPKAAMILVADEKHVPKIVSRITSMDNAEYIGVVLSNRDGTGETIAGLPVVASLETAADYICREWVDEVFFYPTSLADIEVHSTKEYQSVEGIIDDKRGAYERKSFVEEPEEENEESTVARLIEACRQMAIPVHIRLPISNLGEKRFIEKVGGYNVLTTAYNYASPIQLMLKRLLDIAGGLVGSVMAIFVILVVGPMIQRESPGPILFKQTRIGKNGHKFKIYKIRSMYMDAEERKAELMAQNRNADGMMFKMDWDPRIIGNKIVDGKRVTGIGEKIRSGSWDEWPQFFNILLGQMSLVGTRPPTVDEWEKYKYHHRARLSTKPGLTGMWQVSGRSKITDFEEVVKLDTEYINHWSIGLDIRILLKTVKTVLKKDGAM